MNPGKHTHAHADNLMHAYNAEGPHIVCMRFSYAIAHAFMQMHTKYICKRIISVTSVKSHRVQPHALVSKYR